MISVIRSKPVLQQKRRNHQHRQYHTSTASSARNRRRPRACGISLPSALPRIHHVGLIDDLYEGLSALTLQTAIMFIVQCHMTGHHLGAPAGALGYNPMIHRGRHGIAMQVALCLLDRGLIEPDPAIHTGRGAAGGEQVFRCPETFSNMPRSASC